MRHGLAALQTRLCGPGNRIHWRSEHVRHLAAHYGVAENDVARLLPLAVPQPGRQAKHVGFPATVKSNGDSRTFTFTISTAAVDRQGDTIAVNGWKLDNYRKNPVVLWAHGATLLPIGKTDLIWRSGQSLKASMSLAPAGVNPNADAVAAMLKSGHLRGASIGFMPIKFGFAKEPKRQGGIDFLEQELLEWSVVAIPANAEALLDSSAPKSIGERERARRARMLDVVRLRAGP